MASVATITIGAECFDGRGLTVNVPPTRIRFAVSRAEREQVTLTGSAFTALSPPTSAKAVLITPAAGAVSLVLKSVTGDSATLTIAPASNPIALPLLLPLGASPSLGILNNGATVTADVVWFVG